MSETKNDIDVTKNITITNDDDLKDIINSEKSTEKNNEKSKLHNQENSNVKVEKINDWLLQLKVIEEPIVRAFEMKHWFKDIQVLDAKTTLRYLRNAHKQINNLTRVVNMLLKENDLLKRKVSQVIKIINEKK